MAKLCAERQLRNAFHSPLLFHLVELYERAKCTDLRDDVFGLLSFAIFCCRDAISIDYACSGYQLCNRLFEHHHQAHGHEEEIVRMVKRTENIQKLILDSSSQNTQSISNFIVGGPHEVNIGCATAEIEGILLPKGATEEGRYETQFLRRVSSDELPGFRAEWVTQEMNEPIVLLDDDVYARFSSGVVCRFLGSKIQAFLRKEMDRYRLLGRVVNLKERPFSLASAPGFKSITLNLNIPTLQLLTSPPQLLQVRNRPERDV